MDKRADVDQLSASAELPLHDEGLSVVHAAGVQVVGEDTRRRSRTRSTGGLPLGLFEQAP